MEIWIASGNRKELKKSFPFLREYGVIDVKEIATSLGYESSLLLDDHTSFVLNNEIIKRLDAFNSSRRFYRVLFLVEDAREDLAHDLLSYSMSSNLKYEAIYLLRSTEFSLVCKSY
jgi:hypothetical protein